jgi:uncharacterized protein YqhQ
MAVPPPGVGRWIFVRGVVSLVESLRLGSEALRFSIEQMESDLPIPGVGVLSAFALSVLAIVTRSDDAGPPHAAPARRAAGGPLMLVMAIAFFVALPQGLAAVANRLLGLDLAVQSPGFQAITGALKLAIVVGYMLAIRRVPEIKRVFQYHGAEHKTISTYEAGEPLSVDSARGKTTFHARCGTTFLVMVVIVSIALFAVVGALLPRIHTGNAVVDNLLFFACKLPFLPLLVAVTFELQRAFARYASQGPLRVLLWPGFLVQKITTAEPDDAQLEVALASLRATLYRQQEKPTTEPRVDTRFPSYAELVNALPG